METRVELSRRKMAGGGVWKLNDPERAGEKVDLARTGASRSVEQTAQGEIAD